MTKNMNGGNRLFLRINILNLLHMFKEYLVTYINEVAQ